MPQYNYTERVVRWVFTCNNPPGGGLWSPPSNSRPAVNYSICQLEKGEQGTIHVQGYMRLANGKAMNAFKKYLEKEFDCPGAHVEHARGTEEDSIKYCSKSDTRLAGPWVSGTPARPGKRVDLEGAAEEVIKNGIAGLKNIEAKILVKHGKGLLGLNAAMPPPYEDNREVRIITIIGKTGIGKTWNTYDSFRGEVGCAGVTNNALWFDQYFETKVCLFDEFNGGVPLQNMLRYLDQYMLMVPVKGGFKWSRWKVVVITSNVTPEGWYPGVASGQPEAFAALLRRLKRGSPYYINADTREEMSAKWAKLLNYDTELAGIATMVGGSTQAVRDMAPSAQAPSAPLMEDQHQSNSRSGSGRGEVPPAAAGTDGIPRVDLCGDEDPERENVDPAWSFWKNGPSFGMGHRINKRKAIDMSKVGEDVDVEEEASFLNDIPAQIPDLGISDPDNVPSPIAPIAVRTSDNAPPVLPVQSPPYDFPDHLHDGSPLLPLPPPSFHRASSPSATNWLNF